MLQEMLQQISPLIPRLWKQHDSTGTRLPSPCTVWGGWKIWWYSWQALPVRRTCRREKGSPDLLCRQRCCGRGRDADHTGSHCRRYPQFYHGHRFSQRPVPCLRGRCFSRGHRRGGGTALRRHNFQKDRRRHPQLCP